MATFNFNNLFGRKSKDDRNENSSGFNQLINQSGNNDETKNPSTSGFNDLLNGPEEYEEPIVATPGQAGQSGMPADDSMAYEQGRSGGISKAGVGKGSNKPATEGSGTAGGGPQQAEKTAEEEPTKEPKEDEQKPQKEAEPEKASEKQPSPGESKAGEKPKEAEKAGGKAGGAQEAAKPKAGAGTAGAGKLAAGGVAGFAAKFKSFVSKNRNEVAIGGGIMGVFISALIFVATVAPLKIVDLMENIYKHRFHRLNHAFDVRKKKVMKKYFDDWACGHVVSANTCEKFTDGAVVNNKRKGFFRNISDNLRKSDYNDKLRDHGYKFEITTDNKFNVYKEGKVVNSYDLMTNKASARKDVNLITSEVTKGEGWFKRWRSKKWFQKISGTKWHWLDPINQPKEAIKKKVISEVVDYLLENKITGEFANKLILALLGSEASTNLGAESFGSATLERAAPIFESEIAGQKAVETLAEKGVEKASSTAVKTGATTLGEKFATAIADSSNPIGWIIAIVQVGCSIVNIAHDQTIQHTLAEYTQIQYVTMFTKYQSVASEVKEGNKDGKMGQDELEANMDLLSSADGTKDVANSNNYQRAVGNPISYDVNNEDVQKCDSGKELCHERQPNNILESTPVGKLVLYGLAALDPDTRKQLTGFDFGGKYNPLNPGNALGGWTCKVVGGIGNALSWLIGKAFEDFKNDIDMCAGKPIIGDIPIPLLGGTTQSCNKWHDDIENGTKLMSQAFSWINEHLIIPLLDLIVSRSVRGPDLVNVIAAGAEISADSQMGEDLDAKPLNKDELAESERQYYAELRDNHEKASIQDKLLSLDDPYSMWSRILHNTPSNSRSLTTQTMAFVSRFINPTNFVKNSYSTSSAIAKISTQSALADDVVVTGTEKNGQIVNEFGMRVSDKAGDIFGGKAGGEVFGWPDQMLNDEDLGSDKLQKLDEQTACSLVANIGANDNEKPEECKAAESSGSTGGGPGETIGGTGDYIWPLKKEQSTLTQCYGHPNSGGPHPGLDIGASHGSPIFATADGKVVRALDGAVEGDKNANGGAGNYVSIDHQNGIWTRYLHMVKGSLKVHEGDQIKKGQQIGEVDNTGYSGGNHLHLEFRTGGEWGGSSQTHNPLYYIKDTQGVGNLQLCPTGMDETR